MGDLVQRVRELVAADKLPRAIDELRMATGESNPQLQSELVQHQAAITKAAADLRRRLITREEEERVRTHVRYAVLDLLTSLGTVESAPAAPKPAANAKPSVFVSYSRTDADVAQRLCAELAKHDIQVHIDAETFAAGENFKHAIQRCIRVTDATVCLVSRRSLLSSWVSMETLNRFHESESVNTKKFIAAYLDADFLDPGFRLEATKQIDTRIAEIDALIPSYVEQRIDTNDLNDDKSRLFDLRNNLGTILQRLRASLVVDLRDSQFAAGVGKIIAALK